MMRIIAQLLGFVEQAARLKYNMRDAAIWEGRGLIISNTGFFPARSLGILLLAHFQINTLRGCA
jgi:hypothetical protein